MIGKQSGGVSRERRRQQRARTRWVLDGPVDAASTEHERLRAVWIHVWRVE
jgi:hypothetical protein